MTQPITYLNNASRGIRSARATNRLQQFLERELTIGQARAEREIAEELAQIKYRVAVLLGSEEHLVALSSNTSQAFAIVVPCLLMQGARVLVAPGEWAANVEVLRRTWPDLKIEVLATDDEGQLAIAQIQSQIDEDVAAIFAPMVTSIGGCRYPVEALGKLPRPSHCWFVVDAAQALGQTPVNVTDIGCDVLIATTRKWLRGPRGLALMALSSRVLKQMHPVRSPDLAGLIFHPETGQFVDHPTAQRFGRFDQSVLSRLELSAAMDELEALSVETVETLVKAHAALIFAQAQELGLTPILSQPQSGIATLVIPDVSAEILASHLQTAGIVVKICDRAPEPLNLGLPTTGNLVRISAHVHNSDAEIERALRAIAAISTSR